MYIVFDFVTHYDSKSRATPITTICVGVAMGVTKNSPLFKSLDPTLDNVLCWVPHSLAQQHLAWAWQQVAHWYRYLAKEKASAWHLLECHLDWQQCFAQPQWKNHYNVERERSLYHGRNCVNLWLWSIAEVNRPTLRLGGHTAFCISGKRHFPGLWRCQALDHMKCTISSQKRCPQEFIFESFCGSWCLNRLVMVSHVVHCAWKSLLSSSHANCCTWAAVRLWELVVAWFRNRTAFWCWAHTVSWKQEPKVMLGPISVGSEHQMSH